MFLLLARGGGGFVIGFGIGVGLLGLVERVLADNAGGEELALALHLELVVLVDGELLLFGRGLGGEGGFLLGGIDLHQELACGDMIAGVDEDFREIAVDLRIDGGGAARLDGRDVFVGLRNRCGGDGDGLDGEGLHAGAGWLLWLRFVAADGSGEQQRQREDGKNEWRLHSNLHDRTSNQGRQDRNQTIEKQLRIQEWRGDFCDGPTCFPRAWVLDSAKRGGASENADRIRGNYERDAEEVRLEKCKRAVRFRTAHSILTWAFAAPVSGFSSAEGSFLRPFCRFRGARLEVGRAAANLWEIGASLLTSFPRPLSEEA